MTSHAGKVWKNLQSGNAGVVASMVIRTSKRIQEIDKLSHLNASFTACFSLNSNNLQQFNLNAHVLGLLTLNVKNCSSIFNGYESVAKTVKLLNIFLETDCQIPKRYR